MAWIRDLVRQRLLHKNADAVADDFTRYFDALRRMGVNAYDSTIAASETRFLHGMLRLVPKALVIDVGAHKGDYARSVLSASPEAKVVCFEPHPGAYQSLRSWSDSVPNAAAHQVALSSASGSTELYDYSDGHGTEHATLYRGVIEDLRQRPTDSVAVERTTLDLFGAANGIEQIDLLKIDTEGHEWEVLQGSRDFLSRRAVAAIQFEFNEMNVLSRVFFRDFYSLLMPDFRMFRLTPRGVIEYHDYQASWMELFSYQNIVCLRRDLPYGWIYGSG